MKAIKDYILEKQITNENVLELYTKYYKDVNINESDSDGLFGENGFFKKILKKLKEFFFGDSKNDNRFCSSSNYHNLYDTDDEWKEQLNVFRNNNKSLFSYNNGTIEYVVDNLIVKEIEIDKLETYINKADSYTQSSFKRVITLCKKMGNLNQKPFCQRNVCFLDKAGELYGIFVYSVENAENRDIPDAYKDYTMLFLERIKLFSSNKINEKIILNNFANKFIEESKKIKQTKGIIFKTEDLEHGKEYTNMFGDKFKYDNNTKYSIYDY